MSEQGHLSADLGHDDQFEREMRGYNRREVDEAIAALRITVRSLEDGKRDLQDRLSQALDDVERLKLELSTARSAGKPPHEEVSERVGQILKLAADEATSMRSQAEGEIAKLRSDAQAETGKLRTDAKAETDRSRAEAHEQAERMLSAAQEQADNTVATAKAEADTTRKSAATDAQRVLGDATKQAESAVATAKAQAKQQLDEATARATAIHDGAERRLNLLMSRHTEAIRRLTEIRDVVTTLVAGETDRGSLEDEVARAVAGAMSGANAAAAAAGTGDGQPNGRGTAAQPGRPNSEGRHASGPGQAGAAHGNGAPQAGGQHGDARHAPVAGARAAAADDTADGIAVVAE
ncbi:MAG: hypothetical protein ACLQFR_32390 [Streptosporangiaceae bacterium]